ncbi:MAG TPA: WYL domain-containing protein [Anaeromyxobacteraceae bacterium]|nr:WYL domain-containing protein [Anaeromyxobacteraceae bacterium]
MKKKRPPRRPKQRNTAFDHVRQMIVLVPAAWKAGRDGLPLERAARIAGARSAADVKDVVDALGAFDVGPSMPEDFLAVSVVDGRVVVDSALHLVTPPPLSVREAAALMAALRPFAAGGGPAVAAALRKLRRAVPAPFREQADELARTTDFPIDPPGEWADALSEAIERRLEVDLEYRAEGTGTAAARTVEPRALFHQGGHWYLAAWNVEKEEEHLFRLDRIASAVIGTRAFGEHKGPPLERYRTRHLYFQSGGERDVKVRLTGDAATAALERWPGQAARNDDGSVTLAMRVTPGNFLYGWVLGHGGRAAIEGPDEARAGLAERVEELRRLYAAT